MAKKYRIFEEILVSEGLPKSEYKVLAVTRMGRYVHVFYHPLSEAWFTWPDQERFNVDKYGPIVRWFEPLDEQIVSVERRIVLKLGSDE